MMSVMTPTPSRTRTPNSELRLGVGVADTAVTPAVTGTACGELPVMRR